MFYNGVLDAQACVFLVHWCNDVLCSFCNWIRVICSNTGWDRLVHLSLMSLQRRRERFIILHMWKILHHKTSNDLDIQFVVRPRFENLAIIPSKRRASSAANQSLFDNSFAVQGPKLWNAIPYHLNVTKDLERFKDQLTKFMLSLPDKPPIRGYTPPNSNSLLCWRNERGFTSLWGDQKIWWPCQILTKLHIGHIGRSCPGHPLDIISCLLSAHSCNMWVLTYVKAIIVRFFFKL